MGQKVNPHGLRVGIIQDWDTKWYADKKKFGDMLVEDYKLREMLMGKLNAAGTEAGVPKIEIERAAGRVKVSIYTAKPGVVIGKGGTGVDEIKAEIEKFTAKRAIVNIVEVKDPDKNAQLIADNIAQQLENRVSFRRAMKQSMSRAMKCGALGIKTMISGRVNGADIARTEQYHEGTIPLQTLRADIDYGFAEAHTTYGKLGIKVWVYNGEILQKKDRG